MRGSAASKSARTADSRPPASPTRVRTLRLCAASEETERRRAPRAARTARAISSIQSRSLPSEMFGTHSMTVLIGATVYNWHNRVSRKAPFPPGRRRRGRPLSGGGVSTNPGLYPGNPSLPREVRDKILSTFKHTISLYHEGKVDDCVIGCDFILKMDPRFSPARRLLEKSKNPAADVDLIELEAIVASMPARSQRPSAADAEKLLIRAVESFNARDFDACIQVAEQVLTALPGNVHAADLIERSKHKKKVQGDFEASRTRALAFLDGRRYPEAAVELEKMRSLDEEHPAVSLLERRLQQAGVRPDRSAGAGADSGLGGMMDFGEAGGGMAASEPALSYDPGAGSSPPPSSGSLNSLSLDS